MTRKQIIYFVGFSFLLVFCFTTFSKVQAANYENQAVVSFYQDDAEEPEKDVAVSSPAKEMLPKTGSVPSYLGYFGVIVLVIVWGVKKYVVKR